MTILVGILIFCAGISIGYGVKSFIMYKFENQVGYIDIERTDEKTVFTLELKGDPENLRFKKRVIFTVRNLE